MNTFTSTGQSGTSRWFPFPQQEKALRSRADEILFGGARGGGKTDTGLVWLTYDVDHPRYRALVIRKNADDLSDWLDRAARFYAGLGAEIVYRPAVIRFPSGAVIRTGHLKDDQAYTKYQGHEYQRILIEELTQIPDEKRYLQLISSCRSTVPELRPQVFCTTNPGGVGHAWVKKRFVDLRPHEQIHQVSGKTRIYIPATVEDNPALMENDPDYVKVLDQLRSVDEELYKAWRLGDWETFAGQFFREWNVQLHVTDSFYPPVGSRYFGGVDWGFYPSPFVFLLACLFPVAHPTGKFYRCVICREIRGFEKTPPEWARLILAQIPETESIFADPSMFSRAGDGGLSIAESFANCGLFLRPGTNHRIAGAANVRSWLSIAPDGYPFLQVTRNCLHLIQNLPQLIHDENNPEDVDTQGPDHEFDALKYLLSGLRLGEVGAVSPRAQVVSRGPAPAGARIDPGKFR